jgi:hypothetical protein
MLEFARLKQNRRKFLALTGLTLKEFNAVLPAFTAAYAYKYPHDRTVLGRKRKRQRGGGRQSALNTMEQKLLFIL